MVQFKVHPAHNFFSPPPPPFLESVVPKLLACPLSGSHPLVGNLCLLSQKKRLHNSWVVLLEAPLQPSGCVSPPPPPPPPPPLSSSAVVFVDLHKHGHEEEPQHQCGALHQVDHAVEPAAVVAVVHWNSSTYLKLSTMYTYVFTFARRRVMQFGNHAVSYREVFDSGSNLS